MGALTVCAFSFYIFVFNYFCAIFELSAVQAYSRTRTRTRTRTRKQRPSNAEAASLLGVNLFLIFIIYLRHAISCRLRRQQRQQRRRRHCCQARPLQRVRHTFKWIAVRRYWCAIQFHHQNVDVSIACQWQLVSNSGLRLSGLCTLACN